MVDDIFNTFLARIAIEHKNNGEWTILSIRVPLDDHIADYPEKLSVHVNGRLIHIKFKKFKGKAAIYQEV